MCRENLCGFSRAILISPLQQPILPWQNGKNPNKNPHPDGWGFLFGAGYEARTRFPVSHEPPAAIRGNPTSPLIKNALRAWVEAASSFLLTKKQDIQIRCPVSIGAGYEARTRYLHLGKVALYQMS